jgi:hypothetical protein
LGDAIGGKIEIVMRGARAVAVQMIG